MTLPDPSSADLQFALATESGLAVMDANLAKMGHPEDDPDRLAIARVRALLQRAVQEALEVELRGEAS